MSARKTRDPIQEAWDKLCFGAAPYPDGPAFPRHDYEAWLAKFHVNRRAKKKKTKKTGGTPCP